jgi:hypothetical protein
MNATAGGRANSVPRLAGRLGEVCAEACARANGAALFVRSPA